MSFADASVGTDRLFRERFSVLPDMKSKYVQTDASWLRSRSVAVNTDLDPSFSGWRRRRMRGTHPPASLSPLASDRETQTDVTVPSVRDASAQANLCCLSDLHFVRLQEPTATGASAESAAASGETLSTATADAPRASPDSLSSMDLDPSPAPPLKQMTDQAVSPLSLASLSPPPPPPPLESPSLGVPVAMVEVVITPPPPIAPPSPADPCEAASPSLPLPPVPRLRSAVTSGTNSQNASDGEEEECDHKRFKSLKDDEFFKKYAMRPRRGTLTLRSIKDRSESRRQSTAQSHAQVASETRPASPTHDGNDGEGSVQAPVVGQATPAPPPLVLQSQAVPQKISNITPSVAEPVATAAATAVTASETTTEEQPPPAQTVNVAAEVAAADVQRETGRCTEYVEKLKDPDASPAAAPATALASTADAVKKTRSEVLSASSPNLLSEESSVASAKEAGSASKEERGSEEQDRLRITLTPHEMRTQSKIVIQVINSRRRETSEVTSYAEVLPDGKITRKTTVTTSKKVPVLAIDGAASDGDAGRGAREAGAEQAFLPRRHPGKTPEPIVTSPPSTKATSSPVPKHIKTRTTMHSVAPSECSSRATSAAEDVTIASGTTPLSHDESLPSSAFTPEVPISSESAQQPPLLSPVYPDPEVEKVARLVQQVLHPFLSNGVPHAAQSMPSTLTRSPKRHEALHRDAHQPPLQSTGERHHVTAKSPPPKEQAVSEAPAAANLSWRRKPRVVWHETSHSSVTNEMVTDAFKDDDGKVVKPKGVTMQSETLIDNTGKDARVTTRSKAQRQFDGKIEEPEITSETTVSDVPPMLQMEPRRLGFPRRRQTAVAPPPQEHERQKPCSPDGQLQRQPQQPLHQHQRVLDEAVAEGEKKESPSRIPEGVTLSTPAPVSLDRKKRMKSDPGRISVKGEGMRSVAEDTTAMSTPLKSGSRTSVKSPPAFMESSLDDLEACVPDVLSPNIFSTDISTRDPESRAESRVLSPPSPAERKSRREKIIESARRGQLFSEVNKALQSKSLSFADISVEGKAQSDARKHSSDSRPVTLASAANGFQKLHPKLKSSNDLDKVLPLLPSLTSSKSGTELVTKITRRTHPAELVDVGGSKTLRPKRSKLVLEQDIKTGDGVYDVTGCHMLNRITVDNPCLKKKSRNPFGSFSFGKLKRKSSQQHLAIRSDEQEKENTSEEGKKRSKRLSANGRCGKEFSKSLGDLRAPDDEEEDEEESQGVMLTETKFERLVPNPMSGKSNHQTTWEYSLECKCVNGLNTSVKTNVKHRRSYVPLGLTMYESSV